MKLLVTGATGFIGHHLVPKLIAAGHQVTVIARSEQENAKWSWQDNVRWIKADIYQLDKHWINQIDRQDALIHLAWQGLPNYEAEFHIKHNLPAESAFLETVIKLGIKQVLVTGTCFEYGNQSGCLDETCETLPNNNYAIAKDKLRKYLVKLQKKYGFRLKWARLFYMYGEGQSGKSLLGQLKTAIEKQQTIFNMSGGEQVRDYLPVETVAEYLLKLIECQDCDGIVNICSGQPITIRTMVEKFLIENNFKMELNLGYYPYLDNEPMAFWGNQHKLQNWIIKLNSGEKL